MKEAEDNIDPIKTIGLQEVIARTGFGRTTIFKLLAKDRRDETPGKHFPQPVTSIGHLRWQEKAVVRWMTRISAVEA